MADRIRRQADRSVARQPVHILADPTTAEEYTFVTETYGGRRAVGDLANEIAKVRCAHPGAIPLVSLSSEMMPTKMGPRPKPYFNATALVAIS
jgi:hypothetical protein